MKDEDRKQLTLESLSEKGKNLNDDGSITSDEQSTDGASNLFEEWGMSYAEDSASSVYSWGRD